MGSSCNKIGSCLFLVGAVSAVMAKRAAGDEESTTSHRKHHVGSKSCLVLSKKRTKVLNVRRSVHFYGSLMNLVSDECGRNELK